MAGDRVGVGPAGRDHRRALRRRRRRTKQDPRARAASPRARSGPSRRRGERARRRGSRRVRRRPRRVPSRPITPGGSDSRPIACPDDPSAENDEHERVDKRGEHLRAPPAEAPLRRRRALREPGGEERQAERERVREHVRRVGEKRQRVGRDADERLDAGEAEHERGRARARARVCRRPPCACTCGTVARCALT